MLTNLNNLTKEIIENNEYLSLATVDEIGKPWICILAYSFDEKYNFYFLSFQTSKHAEHIKNNGNVSFSIFDSRQLFGYGVGLQIEGRVKEVDSRELSHAEEIYMNRKYPYGNVNNEFMDELKKLVRNKAYRFYKIEPKAIWINNPDASTDVRVKVHLD